MADEFFNTMSSYSEAPLKERIDGMGDVIEKIMTIVLRIPDLVDTSITALLGQIQSIDGKIGSLEGRFGQLQNKVNTLQVAPAGAGGAPPPPGGGAPPPPPPGGGAPPPPPPGGKPGGGGPPANPMSLRGSIMDELKNLFSKRRSASEDE
jgi:hypothetical protein